MAEDSLRESIDAVRAHLQRELEAQLAGLADQHGQAVAAARAAANADVEQRVASEVTRVRMETERQLQDEVGRIRKEAEQQLQEELTRARADADARVAAASVKPPETAALLHAFHEIQQAASVGAILDAIARGAAAQAPGATLALWQDGATQPWGTTERLATDAPIVSRAIAAGGTVREGQAAAVPLALDGTVVGVLYCAGTTQPDQVSVDGLEAIGRFGAAQLAAMTAIKTAHARQWIAQRTGTPTVSTAVASEDPESAEAARRYARLLVSEIKLYNEATVRAGREHRDLLRRLGPEVERARRMYEERVAATVAGRAGHFQQELVQILADGNPALLG